MAADNVSPLTLLNWVPLTTAVQQVMTDLPKPLPSTFYTQTKDVLGNAFRRFIHRGTRQTALQGIYGSPPRMAPQVSFARQDAVLIHSSEIISAGEEVMALFHRFDDYTVQMAARDILDERAKQYGLRLDNLRIASIHSMAANGKIWFDSAGGLLNAAGGAYETVDYQIPAGNRVSSGVNWSDPDADVPTYLSNFLTDAMIAGGGRKPNLAICGRNIQGYLSRNTKFKDYLARNPQYNQYYINNNQIAPGTLGLTWVMAQDAYYERPDGTLLKQFPDDQITLFPDLTRDVYELKQGSQPVPKAFMSFQTGGDFNDIIGQMFTNPVYGPFRYAYGQALPMPQIVMVQGDNFLPDLPNPASVWFLDTTP